MKWDKNRVLFSVVDTVLFFSLWRENLHGVSSSRSPVNNRNFIFKHGKPDPMLFVTSSKEAMNDGSSSWGIDSGNIWTETLKVNMNLGTDSAWKKSKEEEYGLEIPPIFRCDYTDRWETEGGNTTNVLIILMLKDVLSCWHWACIISENFPLDYGYL